MNERITVNIELLGTTGSVQFDAGYIGFLLGPGFIVTPADAAEPCKWKYNKVDGYWGSDCGVAFVFDNGGPSENGFLHCPKCRKPLEEVA